MRRWHGFDARCGGAQLLLFAVCEGAARGCLVAIQAAVVSTRLSRRTRAGEAGVSIVYRWTGGSASGCACGDRGWAVGRSLRPSQPPAADPERAQPDARMWRAHGRLCSRRFDEPCRLLLDHKGGRRFDQPNPIAVVRPPRTVARIPTARTNGVAASHTCRNSTTCALAPAATPPTPGGDVGAPSTPLP